MAKTVSVPNLPASSRLQMPSTGGDLSKETTEYGGMKGDAGSVSSTLKGGKKGSNAMKGTNPYK